MPPLPKGGTAALKAAGGDCGKIAFFLQHCGELLCIPQSNCLRIGNLTAPFRQGGRWCGASSNTSLNRNFPSVDGHLAAALIFFKKQLQFSAVAVKMIETPAIQQRRTIQ